jgi:hypothetical protein
MVAANGSSLGATIPEFVASRWVLVDDRTESDHDGISGSYRRNRVMMSAVR